MDSKIPFTRLKEVVAQLEQQPQFKDRLDEVEISFEFIVGTFFPDILQNIKDALNEEHTKGYIEGYEASKAINNKGVN